MGAAARPSINVELIRGILVAFLGYECYRWADAFRLLANQPYYLPIMEPPAHRAALVFGLFVGAVICSLLLYGLLFHPNRSAKVLFISLCLLALLELLSVIHLFTHGSHLPNPPPISWRIVSSLTSIGMAVLGYFHYRGWKQLQRV
jgi:hypothetical protein